MRRRHFLQAAAASGAFWYTRGLYAEALTLTPRMTEGPFYPEHLPLDRDNDLIIVGDSTTPALGKVTHLSGRVLSPTGEPIRNAYVEIWQCDQNGAYLHSRTNNAAKRDQNFQGYGQFLTDSKGAYRFRTIKPVPYPGRTPHIHFGISRHGKRVLTTQLFVKGDPGNERDGLLKSIKDQKALENILGEFKPIPDSPTGELAVNFDLILGVTPSDPDDPEGGSGIGKSERAQGIGFGPGRRGTPPPNRP